MKSTLLIGLALAAGVATADSRAETGAPATRWQGYVLRDGIRSAIAVDLSDSDRGWAGRLSVGGKTLPLEQVRVSATRVHFELPGESVFDGSIAENEMAGAGSGNSDGSFWLVRNDTSYSPYLFGP